MLFGGMAGSRTFDGAGWSDVAPWGSSVVPMNPYVQYYDSGEPDVVTRTSQVRHFHFDGVARDAGTYLEGIQAEDAAAAADDAGRLVVAFVPETFTQEQAVMARMFDGTAWGPATIIGPSTTWKEKLFAFADEAGRFVVLWDEPLGITATFHDGAWHPAQLVADGGAAFSAADMNRAGLITLVNDCEGYNTLSASFVALEP